MSDTSRLELKVGIFVFIGLVLLVIFVLMIGDFRLINPGYTFKASFGFANGIKVNAPVRLSGVEIGEVKGIDVVYDDVNKEPKVILDIWVQKKARVPVDSRVWVNMLGVLGEKYIEIIPGKEQNNLVAAGSMIKGEDPISIQELTVLGRQIALQVEETVADVSKSLDKLDGALDAFSQSAKTFDVTLGSVNRLVQNVNEGKGTVGKLFYDESLYDNIDEMFQDLKKNPWKLLHKPKEK